MSSFASVFDWADENGFALAPVPLRLAKGFSGAALDVWTPKSVSPRFDGCFGACEATDSSFAGGGGITVTALLLTALNALVLPSFRRQAFRLHDHTYNRRS